MPVQLACTDLGSGPPLVILHGLFGCKENWGCLARQLARLFRVITLDLRTESPHHSSRLFGLIIEDIGPHAYPPYHEKLFAILEQLPLARLTSRSDADSRLRS